MQQCATPEVAQRSETVPLLHPKYGAVEDVYGMACQSHFPAPTSASISRLQALGEHNDMVYGQILSYSSDRMRN